MIYLRLCMIGTALLVTAVILTWKAYDKPWLWLGMLIIGEIVTWIGVIPILSKFLSQ